MIWLRCFDNFFWEGKIFYLSRFKDFVPDCLVDGFLGGLCYLLRLPRGCWLLASTDDVQRASCFEMPETSEAG